MISPLIFYAEFIKEILCPYLPGRADESFLSKPDKPDPSCVENGISVFRAKKETGFPISFRQHRLHSFIFRLVEDLSGKLQLLLWRKALIELFHILIPHVISLWSLVHPCDPIKVSRDQFLAEKER